MTTLIVTVDVEDMFQIEQPSGLSFRFCAIKLPPFDLKISSIDFHFVFAVLPQYILSMLAIVHVVVYYVSRYLPILPISFRIISWPAM